MSPIHHKQNEKEFSLRRWTITRLLIPMALFLFYNAGGVYYNHKEIKKLRQEAIVKADTNKDGKLDINELLNAYITLGDNKEKILKRLSLDAKKNYLKQTSIKSNIPSELTEHYLMGVQTNLYRLEDYLKVFEKLADKDGNGLSIEEVKEAYKIAYNGIGKELDLNAWQESELQEVARLFFCPYILHKGSDLEKYVKGETPSIK